MNEEDYSAWRGHPITREMFRYYKDYAAEIGRIHATEDYGGKSSDEVARIQAQTYGMCSVYEDLVELTADDINNFYKIEAENEEIQQAGNTPD